MSFLASNLKFLRGQKELTQAQLAEKLGLNRSAIGAYEEGRADPRVKTLINICHYFNVTPDQMLNANLVDGKRVDLKGDSLRVLPVTVNKESERELIPLVPQKAAAGYTAGYGDADYIESLAQFDLPFGEINLDRTYRMFQIEGDSMLPIPPGAYILATFVLDWTQVKDGQCYVVATKDDGVVYKRVVNRLANDGVLELHSDNSQYAPYEVKASELLELWHATGYFSFSIPEKGSYQPELNEMMSMVTKLQEKMEGMGSKREM